MHLSPSIKAELEEFFKLYPVERAYVFGSFARGEARPDSDLDILVEIDRSKPFGLGFVGMHLELEELLGRKVDLVTRKALSKYIEPFVTRDLKLIYARAKA